MLSMPPVWLHQSYAECRLETSLRPSAGQTKAHCSTGMNSQKMLKHVLPTFHPIVVGSKKEHV